MIVAIPLVLIGIAMIAVTCSQSDQKSAETTQEKLPEVRHTNKLAGLPPEQIVEQGQAFTKRWDKENANARAVLAGKAELSGDATITNDEWTDMHAALSGIPKDTKQYAQAQSILAGLDKRDAQNKKVIERYSASAHAEARVEARVDFAKETENTFLSDGFSVTIRAIGKDKDTLDFQYALVSKALAYQVRNNTDFLGRCRKEGFKKVILRDGYDETYSMDLTK